MRDMIPGDVLDARYRIDGILGKGGFAAVYRAVELAGGRPVAVKVLTPGSGGYSADQLARFEREVGIVQTLRDPHTVRMYGHGRTPDGAPYAVFELVDGRELAEIVRGGGPLSPPIVEHIVRQLLYALREAHHKGLVHRDLKPENILVYQNGADPWAVKLLDFGIARPMNRQDARLTATGELIGTPRYMSPEQLTEAPLSAASDIYSLGIVTFELLFGSEALHGGRWGDQLERLRTEHKFVAPVPTEDLGVLPELIRRMTERRVELRLPSAEAALALLDRTRPTRPPEHRPADERSGPSVRRAWFKAFAAIGLFALLGVIGMLVTRTPDPHGPMPTSARPTPHGLVKGAPVVAPPVATKHAPPVVTPPADATLDAGEPTTPTRGCGAPPPFEGPGTLGGKPIYIPRRYAPDHRHPVVILLHDSGQLAEDLLSEGGFGQLADKHAFVVIAPQDRITAPWEDPEDDRPILEILERTTDELCIDRTRVFLAAHGDGGRVARRVCADWVTGAAVFSFRDQPGSDEFALCKTPMPYMYIAPLDSDFEPIDGQSPCRDRKTMPLEAYDALLRKTHHCRGTARPWAADKEHCEEWSCAEPYVRCTAPGGRRWAGVPRLTWKAYRDCDGPASKINIAEQMWKFFATLDPLDLPTAQEPEP